MTDGDVLCILSLAFASRFFLTFLLAYSLPFCVRRRVGDSCMGGLYRRTTEERKLDEYRAPSCDAMVIFLVEVDVNFFIYY